MAEDKIEILGRWRVSFEKLNWEYIFDANGTVRWRDPMNGQGGGGRWSLTNATVYVTWTNSKTTEVWDRPIKQKGQSGAIDADYGKGPFTADKVLDLVLPAAQGSSDQIDLELDLATGEYVQSDPKTNPRYIDRIFTAVAYGILPDGYYVYCQDMDLPILVPETMVDFALARAESERSQIYDNYPKAKTAANDTPALRRVAYFWGAGGTVVSPTTIGPATTPELYSTIIAVRGLRDQFVGVMLPWITMAIGMIEGPKTMTISGNQTTGRVAAKRGGSVPARRNPLPGSATLVPKVKPFNGQVSVGGGFENPNGSNLNPIKVGSGGPSKNIPNHVLGGMEDMAARFEGGSVNKMISSRLRYGDVDWTKGTQAASKVMAPGSRVAMNVWCSGAEEQQALKAAFEGAGFKNVRVAGDGTGTMLFADF